MTGPAVPPKENLSQAGARPVSRTRAAKARPPAPPVLVDDATFEAALAELARLDRVLVAAIGAAGLTPRLRRRPSGFAGLASIVVAQQVSTASADAIFGRLQASFPTLDAAAIGSASDAELRLCGLSAAKARTLRAIADAVVDGRLDFEALAHAPAEDAHATLCTIKGIGPWTADIFLLFCLGHADAWPVGDLALQEGARLALGLSARPDAMALQELGERWRPLRGVAAHCLWAYYGLARARPAGTAAVPNPALRPPAALPRKRRKV